MLQKTRYKMVPAYAMIFMFLCVMCWVLDAKEFDDNRTNARDDFVNDRFNEGIRAIASDPAVKTATSEAILKNYHMNNDTKEGSDKRLKDEDQQDSFDDVDGFGSDSEDIMMESDEVKQKEDFREENSKIKESNDKVLNRSVEKTASVEDTKRSHPEDVIKIVPKDGRFFAVDESSTGEILRNSKLKGGAPFFIADDGKSIQLPKSDVIYNTETGDIVIRNRNVERPKVEDILEPKPSNIRIESTLSQKSSGATVLESENKTKTPLVYTVPIIENNKSHKEQSDASIYNFASKEVGETTTEIESNFSFYKKTDSNNLMEGKISSILDKKEKQHIALTAKDSEDTTQYAFKSGAEVTLNPFDIGKIIPSENARNGKKSIDRNAEDKLSFKSISKEIVDKADSIENIDPTKLGADTTEVNDDEPIYKFPITTEKPKTTKETQRFEDSFNDSYKPEEAVPRIITGTSSRGRVEDIALVTTTMEESENTQEGLMKKNAIDKSREDDYEQRPENFIVMPVKSDGVLDKNGLKQNSSPVKDIFIPIKKEMKMLNKEEVLVALRGYLEDAYLRPPIAIVVDSEVSNLLNVAKAWEDMEKRGGDMKIGDIVLLAYDQDGIIWMSHHRSSAQGSDGRSLKKSLESIKPTSKRLLSSDPAGALTRAARLLPYDSAVFLFSDGSSPVPPPRLIKLFLSKRIKLYSISSSNVWAMEAAEASGGASVSLNPKPEAQNPQQPHQLYQDQNGQSQKYTAPTYQSEILDHLDQEKQRNQEIYHGASERNLFHEQQNHGNQRDLRETNFWGHHQRGLRALPTATEEIDDQEELDFDEEQTILLRSNLTGIQTLVIPIDSSIRTLIINVTQKPKLATLYGPRGIVIDLLEMMYSSDNDSDGQIFRLPMAKDPTDDDENTEGSEPYQGIWKFTVKINSSEIYDVRVKAETSVRLMAKLVRTTHGPPESKNLKIAVGGTVASVREAVLIDNTGAELEKLNYKYKYADSDELASDVTEVETLRAIESGTVVREAAIPKEIEAGTAFRVRITGRNDKDEPFVRLSKELVAPLQPKANESAPPGRSAKLEDQTLGRGLGDIEAERGVNFNLTKQAQVTTAEGLPMTALQIGSNSKLYGAPGAQMQINFEVTNNRENAVNFRFGAKDDQYFLRSMNPQRQWINGGQTVIVAVTIGITSTAQNGIRDTVTFTANGLDQTQISAYVYVETDGRISQDRSRPYLRYDYRGDCMGYLDSTRCTEKTWGLDITARDTESGLLRINTSPGVIIYNSGFSAGAREEVRARYTATCCETRVLLSATDLNGNIASDEINVSLYFTPITIAAIVLGILLIIALIVGLIFLVRFCLRKRRDSRDLPSYQTQRATRTP